MKETLKSDIIGLMVGTYNWSCKKCKKEIVLDSFFYPEGWRGKKSSYYVYNVCEKCFEKLSRKTQLTYFKPLAYIPIACQLIEFPFYDPILADYLEERGYKTQAERLR